MRPTFPRVGLGDAPKDLILVVLLLVLDVVEDVLGDLLNRLDELRLTGISLLHALDEPIKVDVIRYAHRASLSLFEVGEPDHPTQVRPTKLGAPFERFLKR